MAKDLTHGFDLAVQISQDAVEGIFQSYYWLGNFPNYATREFTRETEAATVEVFFKQPMLRFVEEPGMVNAVRLTFRWTVRISYYDWEHEGAARVVLSAEALNVQDGDKTFTGLGVSFAGVGEDRFTMEPAGEYPEFENVVRPLIVSSLLSTSKPVMLTPSTPLGIGFITWKIYMNPGGDPFVGVFANKGNAQKDPPAAAGSYFNGADQDLRFALPKENVNATVQSKLAEMGLDDLPATIEIDGDDYEVESISIQLKDHYLRIAGEIDDVEFVAKANLYANDDGIHVSVVSLDIDLPWYLDILNVFSGGVIARAVEEALPSGLNEIGGDALGGLGIFSNTVPGVDLVLEMHPHGMVSTSSKGLVVSASVDPIFDPLPVKEPTYIWGNRETKEFHRVGCQYGDKMKWQKKVRFIRESAAVHEGYNGCYTCARAYSHPAGRLMFGYRSAGHAPNDQLAMEIEVEGTLLEPVVVDGILVEDPPFETSRTLKGKTDASGVWQAIDSLSSNLVTPGRWRLKARSGDWTGTCEMVVQPTARNFGATNKIAFTIGKPQGNFGYGSMPEFP